VDPVFWHRALYAAYLALMNSFFWIAKEEELFPKEEIEKVCVCVCVCVYVCL
jgi:hypothetical protein